VGPVNIVGGLASTVGAGIGAGLTGESVTGESVTGAFVVSAQ